MVSTSGMGGGGGCAGGGMILGGVFPAEESDDERESSRSTGRSRVWKKEVKEQLFSTIVFGTTSILINCNHPDADTWNISHF